MGNNTVAELMSVAMSNIKEMVDVNTVVGDHIITPDGATIIPVSRVNIGLVTGGGDGGQKEGGGSFGGGSGAGIKIDPVGFLVIKDGNVRMLNIAPPTGRTADRLVEMIPEIIDRVASFMNKRNFDE